MSSKKKRDKGDSARKVNTSRQGRAEKTAAAHAAIMSNLKGRFRDQVSLDATRLPVLFLKTGLTLFRAVDEHAAVYAIIAGVTMPFLIFVMPRIIASLHPDPIINTRGKVSMNGTMLTVFLSSLAGFTALFFWIYSLKVRLARLEFKRSTEGA